MKASTLSFSTRAMAHPPNPAPVIRAPIQPGRDLAADTISVKLGSGDLVVVAEGYVGLVH